MKRFCLFRNNRWVINAVRSIDGILMAEVHEAGAEGDVPGHPSAAYFVKDQDEDSVRDFQRSNGYPKYLIETLVAILHGKPSDKYVTLHDARNLV